MLKRMFLLIFLLILIIPSSGCTWLAVNLTPRPVVDSVARGNAVATIAVQDPPKTEEELKLYLQVQKELWDELAKYFELK